MTYLAGLAAMIATLLGFYAINVVVRLQTGLRRIPRGKYPTAWWRFAALLALAAAASFAIDWAAIPHGHPTRVLVLVLTALLTWKHFSQDIDITTKVTNELERWVMVTLAITTYWFPLALLPWMFLVLHSFKGWTHHGTVPLRWLMWFVSFALCVVLPGRFLSSFDPTAPWVGEMFWILGVTCHVSHYVIPAIAKMELGRHLWSWAIENRLHHVAASSYSWGWMRFLKRETMAKIARSVAPFDRVLQVVTLVLEFGVIFALFHKHVLYGCLIGLSLMHFGIYFSTGILFWEWVVTNAAICHAIALFDPSRIPMLFSIPTGVACVVLHFVFANRGKLWKPVRLAWWDTPFTQRIHWDVLGNSGKRYSLNNDFMCPHERLYGRVFGYFLVDEKLVTYHLGEVYAQPLSPHHKSSKRVFQPYVDHELRDMVVATRGEPAAIAELKERHGAVLRDEKLEEEHIEWMQRFLRAFNKGKRKFVFPRGLRWLKAPGGQYYYWGDFERFRGQEPVKELILRYREEFFDGAEFRILEDREIRRVPIRSKVD